MLRRWDRPVEMILRSRLPEESGQAGQPAWSVRLTVHSSLLGTFTDPLSRHPEPPECASYGESFTPRRQESFLPASVNLR